MSRVLKISIGQHSDKGRKEVNQDFHGAMIPQEPLLTLKGIAIALADGISTSEVGHIASESAAKGFLTDYYCTSEAWPVKISAHRVIAATNSWLHAQTRRGRDPYDKDKGYVSTLTAMVLKSTKAHIFHVGDARIYRISGHALEQLTEDHRVVLSGEQNYLSRALGANPQIEVDYRAVALEVGDVFLLATDGAYEHVAGRFVLDTIDSHRGDLDQAARLIVEEACRRGSPDNVTVQIVRIDELPQGGAGEVYGQAADLPLPPLLEARMAFDGYRIVRELHASSRSHIYLAVDVESDALVCLKLPSIDLRTDPGYLKRLMMEDWVARRISSAHVLKPCSQARKRNFLYVATEFVDGQTLTQWMEDNPKPPLEAVRGIVEQIAKGLRAFHRMEMVHQDIRPDNVMIDRTGTVKIIDFGSTRVSGIVETEADVGRFEVLGAVQYAAPEYFLGESGSSCSDIFSLGVLTYQMLTGRLPYGAQMPKATTRSKQAKLKYQAARRYRPDLPAWVDGALRKAVHPLPGRRYEDLSEFVYDLRHPNERFVESPSAPLLERNPLLFWKLVCSILALIILGLIATR